MAIWGYFERAYIVNLPSRTDRRRQMLRMLERTGLALEPGVLEFFDAIRPTQSGGFPSVGARGCFLSHLEILKRAHQDRLANVLIMEDDLEIDPSFAAAPEPIIAALRSQEWGLAHLGYVLPHGQVDAASHGLLDYRGPIRTTHFYAVHGALLARLIAFLETALDRPAGHPLGGAMHVDAAYSVFQQQNPDVRRLIAWPSLGWQRRSRGDISPKWFDKIPVLRSLADIARALWGRSRP